MLKYKMLNPELIDSKTKKQFEFCLAAHPNSIGYLANDAHFGYGHPIGGTIGIKDHISIMGVGNDIGCGNSAFLFDTQNLPSPHRLESYYNTVSFRDIKPPRISWNIEPYKTLIEDFKKILDEHIGIGCLDQNLANKAIAQLGSVGSGNHYLNIMIDNISNRTWTTVHCGSRAFGFKVADYYLKKTLNVDQNIRIDENKLESIPLLHIESDLGKEYLKMMYLCLHYAEVNRKLLLLQIWDLMYQPIILKEINSHHNYVELETHNNEEYMVVRKGATKLSVTALSIIGSSMLDNTYIVRGIDSTQLEECLYTTVHGAGRLLSRNQAKKTIDFNSILKTAKEKNIHVFGAGADEAPNAYKNIDDVLQSQIDVSLEIVHILKPYSTMMCS